MANKIVNLFMGADLRSQHDGLLRLALKKKIRVDQLGAEEHVVFINNAGNKVKMYSANGVLSYYRAASGKLNLGMIEMIPACFGASGMDWAKADKLAFEKLFAKETK